MARVTAGTAKDARIVVNVPSGNKAGWFVRWRGGAYQVEVYEDEETYGMGVSIYDGTLSRISTISYGTGGGQITIEHVGSALKQWGPSGEPSVNTTNSYSLASGVWEYNNTLCSLVSFTNLDAPAGHTVDISSGSGGTVSTATLTDVDDTTGKTFTATPNAGYRIASITPSTGVTVTPAASGQTAATTFTVKATQAGSVLVGFELITVVLEASGTATAAATATGSASEVLTAAGTASTTATATGSASEVLHAAGSASAAATAEGAPLEVLPAAGIATVTAAQAGDAREVLSAAGTAGATATSDGAAFDVLAVEGGASATATTEGTVSEVKPAAGSASAHATQTGSATIYQAIPVTPPQEITERLTASIFTPARYTAASSRAGFNATINAERWSATIR